MTNNLERSEYFTLISWQSFYYKRHVKHFFVILLKHSLKGMSIYGNAILRLRCRILFYTHLLLLAKNNPLLQK